LFSRESFRLLTENFETVFQEPGNLQARAGMQLGAAYAGLAIENSMLGAAHALANPLTATYGIAHGQAVGLMLSHVVEFNGAEFDAEYGKLLRASAKPDQASANGNAQRLAEWLTQLIGQAGMETTLAGLGVERGKLPELAEAAEKQWTGNFNPRPVDQANLLSIYENAFGPR